MLDGRKPVAGVRVEAVPLSEDSNPQIGGTTGLGWTAADGRLTLTNLDRGPYRLKAAAPDGRTIENDVGFPITGPLRGVMLLHPYGPPSSMEVVMPPSAAFATAVPVTVNVTDEHDQPCQDGSTITLSTDFGLLLAGKQKAAGIKVATKGGQAAAKLIATKPGNATVTAKHGENEVDAAVQFHGPLSYLLLELGPREPVNSYGATPTGADIPVLCTACDADGHPIPGVPLQVWVQPLPGGRTVSGRTVTAADGKVQITALTDPDHGRYRVTVAHGKLVAAQEFLVAQPVGEWIEASAKWLGITGELSLTLHAKEVSGEMLTVVAEPDDRVLVLDEAGDDAGTPMVDDDGHVAVTLLRVRPGPVDLRIEADGVYSAYLPLGGELVLPDPGPLADNMPVPEPAWREAGRDQSAVPLPEPVWWADLALRVPGIQAYETSGRKRLLAGATPQSDDGMGRPFSLRNPAGVAFAAWSSDTDRTRFTIHRHTFALGQTIDDEYQAKLLPMKSGFANVWDITPDGRRVLVTTRPWLGNGGRTPVWVMDRFGTVDLVAADWRQIDYAAFGHDGTVKLNGKRPGRTEALVYERVPAAAEGA